MRPVTTLWPRWACECHAPNGAPAEHGSYVVRCSVCGAARHQDGFVVERSV